MVYNYAGFFAFPGNNIYFSFKNNSPAGESGGAFILNKSEQ